MDIGKLLKNVHSLNEYISTTHDASEKCKTSRIQLNLSTVLALKKIRSLEIEYFNKCEENGIACVIFERILNLPPAKTWGVLSKEFVNLLQYWLDAIRKHLVRHNLQWWSFLKILLRFIKEICHKDSSLPNILVEYTSECLLDLATNSRPDAVQRHEILHCFNLYCSESSREIRYALRNKFGQYFVKLSTYMASCGHLPTQYSIMETLLRWLLPRQDRTLRAASAAKWFPLTLYAEPDVEIFLERPWVNFFQDARDFLNAHNERQSLITSVVCRKLTVGKVVVISGTERQESWLDINSANRSVTVLMDPRVLETFGSTNHKSFETLVITEENTESAKLHRQSQQLLLSVRTGAPPRLLPSGVSLDEDCDVTAHVTSRCDVTRLDSALRSVFDDKYQLLVDLDKDLELSPLKADQAQNSVQDPRFSHPVEVKRRAHSGYIVKSRNNLACMSPSTASTSSLAQLHDRLAALPRYKYDKEPVSVCAHPELSIVTEYSEADDKQSANTTLKFKPYGVCQKGLNKLDSRKSQSDPECSRKSSKGRRLSPVINEDTTSCLLVATIGSADDSVINDTVERLSKSKDYNPDNIVDLLVQEALQAREKTDKIDSGINTGEKKSDLDDNSEAIENTPNVDEIKLKKVQKQSKILSSTSDESNTEAINETPCYVNTRRKIRKNTPKTDPLNKQSFDEQVVEEFFSQHFIENKETREIIISPTLAKKVNETSSESSDHFGDNFNLITEDIEEDIVPYDFNNIEVLECLNSMVDKVCDVFDKCTKYLNENETTADPEENMPLQDIINTIQDMESKNKNTASKSSKKSMNLKYKVAPKRGKARAAKRKNKLELEPTSKMSTIIEDAGLESAAEKTVDNVSNEPQETISNKEISEIFRPDHEQASTSVDKAKVDVPNDADELKTPQLRRKRKLYSPKDEQLEEETYAPEEPVQSSTKIKKTPKSTATCYKEIEKDRQKHIRMPRTRRVKKTNTPSPRTKKMNAIFDKLKESANNEKVTLADKTFEADAYNFTSDSDDDFKEKKIEISKRNSTTTVASVDSTASRRRRGVKRIDYTDYRSSDESNKVKRKVNRKPRTKKKVSIERNELVDERIRNAKDKDILNTSMVVEKSKTVVPDPDFVREKPPEMEVIEEPGSNPEGSLKKKGKKNIKTEAEPKKSRRILSKAVEVVKNFDDDRTESPLPGLLVEPDVEKEDDVNELSATMVDKFKKIYQEGPEKYVNESNTTQNLLSDIERINYSTTVDVTEELMHIDDQINKSEQEKNVKKKKNTRAKAIKKERKRTSNTSNKENENVISLLEISDVKSERSIETIGITGHGELEEAPPSPNLIRERLEPRNLEVDDLDHSMKDYFNKLTTQMNESNNRDSSTNGDNKDESIVKSISPVVSVKRLSPEDISRWLPSRRNSDSDDSYASAKSMKQIENITKANSAKAKSVQNESNSDISEIIKTKRESLRLLFKNNSKLENNQPEKYEDSDSECSIKSPTIQTRSKKTKVEVKKNEKPKQVKKQTSMISPIKLFDDLISNADKQSESTLSDDEEYMKEIIHTLSKKKALSPALKTKTTSPRHVKQKTSKSIDFAEQKSSKSINTLSSHSKISTSTKIDGSGRLKRKLGEDRERYDDKKKRMEVNNNECVSGSGVTVSSVDDWFKRIEPEGSREEIISASLKHSVQNVMEKLDTTLVEIHRNTSKKFAYLFVDAQKHLSELKEERRGMYKRLASDILTEVVKIMDDKFADLDKRSQQLDGDFMKTLKERTSELIREDCKQKRALVQLLREDVQAVVDHMEKGHS